MLEIAMLEHLYMCIYMHMHLVRNAQRLPRLGPARLTA